MITAKQAVALNEKRRKTNDAREQAEDKKRKAARRVDEKYLRTAEFPKKLKEVEADIKRSSDYVGIYIGDDWRGELLCKLISKQLTKGKFSVQTTEHYQEYKANMDCPDTPEATCYTLHIWWTNKGHRLYLETQQRHW